MRFGPGFGPVFGALGVFFDRAGRAARAGPDRRPSTGHSACRAALDPSNSAGNFEIGSYGGGRAIIDAGNHSGIVIKNLSGIKISALVIQGNGGTTDNDDLLAMKNGILIVSQADAPPEETTYYSNFSIDNVEVSNFEGTGVEIYALTGTALRKVRVSNVVVHDNAREGISVGADDIWNRPNQDIYVGHSLAYH